ncbi:MAG: sulfatase-like hydrolase/transferase [Planctomycetota bacterium]
MNRPRLNARELRRIGVLGVVLFLGCPLGTARSADTPNVILMMADDLGYGDTGFNGNQIIRTPHLDALAKRGVTLTRFHSGNSVCSPTRGTCLTGRHHDRYGIFTANNGHLPKQEVSLARMLKGIGYATGHFGKWHLGTLSKTMSAKGARRRPEENYAPPWERDYDVSFVTESAIRTWDPGLGPRSKNNPFYENGVPVDPNDPSLKGGAARVVVDRAMPFMQSAIDSGTPFLSVVWFHAPHADVAAGPEYLDRYPGHGEAAHFYGCISELDEQVGRIVAALDAGGVADNTLIFFCSDNGPEGKKPSGRRVGTTKGLRGRKRDLYEGGVRVPAFAVWPKRIQANSESDAILSTLDYFPTVAGIVGYVSPDDRPIDGEDVLPILVGKAKTRTSSIPFRYAGGKSSLIEDRFKFLLPERELYDLDEDRAEKTDLASEMPERAAQMERKLVAFFENAKASHGGADYDDDSFRSVEPWRPLVTEPSRTNPQKK